MKWAFLFLVFLTEFDGSIIGLLFKGARRHAWWMALISAAGMTLAATLFQFERNEEARQLRFLDAFDQLAAKDAGVVDPAVWRKISEAKRRPESDGR